MRLDPRSRWWILYCGWEEVEGENGLNWSLGGGARARWCFPSFFWCPDALMPPSPER